MTPDRSVLLAVLAAACITVTCKRDPDVPSAPHGYVKLSVVPTWNGAPFDKTVIYHNANDKRVQVSLVKFYLSPFTLTGSKAAELFDADLFDVTDGPVSRVMEAPIGHYTGTQFGLGLPYDLNHGDITTIDPNAPLGNNSGMYWSWATLYRFCLFEGHFDNDASATGLPPFNFSFHTGMDTLYRTVTLPTQLDVTKDDTTRLQVNVDVARFFTNGSDTLDLAQNAYFHGEVASVRLGIRIADLERDAFRLP